MTHYQKLATMIFRIIGAILMIIGILMAIIGTGTSFFWFGQIGIFIGIFYALPTTVLGIVFFGVGRNLARWVCFDFDRFSEE